MAKAEKTKSTFVVTFPMQGTLLVQATSKEAALDAAKEKVGEVLKHVGGLIVNIDGEPKLLVTAHDEASPKKEKAGKKEKVEDEDEDEDEGDDESDDDDDDSDDEDEDEDDDEDEEDEKPKKSKAAAPAKGGGKPKVKIKLPAKKK